VRTGSANKGKVNLANAGWARPAPVRPDVPERLNVHMTPWPTRARLLPSPT
jgi:hypothetical protein